MKNKNHRMKEKLYELSKKTAIYVLGGNHRLEAYKTAEGAEEEEDRKDVFISFNTIEGLAETSLDICAETCNVMLMLTG